MEKYLPVVNRKECCKVLLEDIIYIESDGRRVRIVTDEDTFYIYAKISDLAHYFEGEERFFPCIKGMVANFEQVCSMKDQVIYFKNGMKYMLGRTNFIKTKQSFVNYMLKANKKAQN